MSDNKSEVKKQIPVQPGIFYQPQAPGEKPYLISNRCKKCGYIAFPKVLTCPSCLEPNTMEEAHFGAKGKIDTFSTCNAALPGFPAPTIQAYVNLERRSQNLVSNHRDRPIRQRAKGRNGSRARDRKTA